MLCAVHAAPPAASLALRGWRRLCGQGTRDQLPGLCEDQPDCLGVLQLRAGQHCIACLAEQQPRTSRQFRRKEQRHDLASVALQRKGLVRVDATGRARSGQVDGHSTGADSAGL